MTVVYTQWEEGGHIRVTDSSLPPVDWPSPLLVTPGSTVRIRIAAPPPQRVEIRAWHSVGGRGVPRSRGRAWVCARRPTDGAPCTIGDGLAGSGDSVVVLGGQPFRRGEQYVAITAYWEPIDLPASAGTNMIVWIFRMRQGDPNSLGAGGPMEGKLVLRP